MSAIVLASGGLDSTVLAYLARDRFGPDVHMLSVDYHQRHRKEIDYARITATRIGARFDVVDLTSVGILLSGSSLTDSGIDVPHGHYAEDSMRSTVVPNRNAIMLAVAFAVAVARNLDNVGTAIHAGDHFVYPDCRPAFAYAFQAMQDKATDGFGTPSLFMPFLNLGKHDIVQIGADLGVPFAATWSCYEGGEKHCGKCGTCVERREAFYLAGIDDPTAYATE